MHISLENFIEILILIFALSLDSFAASLAYGISSIRIPWKSMLVLAGISSLALAFSASLGILVSRYISPEYVKIICFFMLMIPGIIKLFDSLIKSLIRRKCGLNEQFSFSIFSLNFILHIYADPEIADYDQSKSLSVREALPVAVALSLDSLAVGIGASLDTFHFWYAIPTSFVLGLVAIILGEIIGRKAFTKTSYDMTWIGGLMLMVLAIMKLL